MRDGSHYAFGRLHNLPIFFFVCAGDALQHALEAWTPPVVVRRKICAAEKWAAVRSEERGERPSTLSADGLNCGLVSAVHVRTLIAIDFDGNEILIDERGDFRAVV